ncbi:hypothetical protein [Clostridium botulinum]|uniref:hypothetical protein n=1 Tax=Clostridium botulinum TaxID=1491 RepID=UPI000A9B643A|nr:hypothetical protein [Clostridium botulinum]KAI3349549.1 hypothetical protein CIT18_08110 [Clostridium botulinum]
MESIAVILMFITIGIVFSRVSKSIGAEIFKFLKVIIEFFQDVLGFLFNIVKNLQSKK